MQEEILNLIKKENLTVERIQQKTNLEIEEIEKIIKK